MKLFFSGLFVCLAVIIWRTSIGDKVESVKSDGTVSFVKDTMPKGVIDLNGSWIMYFDFSQCNSVIYKGKNIKTKYTITATHKGWGVNGYGQKISEIRNGKETKYKRTSPVSFGGQIQGDIITINFYENNEQEVAGIITLPYGTKNFKLSGNYKALGDNCDGPVSLERVVNK